MLCVYMSKLVPYDQYFVSFDHELENQGCTLFFIDAYAANQGYKLFPVIEYVGVHVKIDYPQN